MPAHVLKPQQSWRLDTGPLIARLVVSGGSSLAAHREDGPVLGEPDAQLRGAELILRPSDQTVIVSAVPAAKGSDSNRRIELEVVSAAQAGTPDPERVLIRADLSGLPGADLVQLSWTPDDAAVTSLAPDNPERPAGIAGLAWDAARSRLGTQLLSFKQLAFYVVVDQSASMVVWESAIPSVVEMLAGVAAVFGPGFHLRLSEDQRFADVSADAAGQWVATRFGEALRPSSCPLPGETPADSATILVTDLAPVGWASKRRVCAVLAAEDAVGQVAAGPYAAAAPALTSASAETESAQQRTLVDRFVADLLDALGMGGANDA
jgi:hypothetical protein